jgi:predicted nucleic acid-binding protein
MGELMAGFVTGTRKDKNHQELHQFLAVARVDVVTVDEHTALYYAQIYRSLRE